MTREIKFRVFDKENRKWLGEDEFFITNEYVWGYAADFDNSNPLDMEKHELMQFTGFKDIDNREIYDGDIVEISGHPLQREGRGEGFGAGIDIDGVYEVARDDRAPSFVIGNWVFHEVYRFCKVIGNIHQHPHLLGGVDK